MSEQKKRRPYVKPEVKRIRLDSQVLLVTGCKLAAGSNKNGTKCLSDASCTQRQQGT